MVRKLRWLVVLAVLAASCSTADPVTQPTLAPSSSSSATTLPISESTTATSGVTTSTANPSPPDTAGLTPADCVEDWPPLTGRTQLTWIENGLILAVIDGELTCLGTAVGDGFQWGPHGDRLLVDQKIRAEGGTLLIRLPPDTAETEWTRPTGLRMLISDETGQLAKVELDGTVDPVDLFPAKLTSFAYHPDGLHIALAEEFGITLARNDGTNPGLLVVASAPTTFSQIQFSDSGTHLWFLAEHDDTRHLHVIDLEAESRPPDPQLDSSLLPMDEDQRAIIIDDELASFVLDPNDATRSAVTSGECDTATTQIVTSSGQKGDTITGAGVGFVDWNGGFGLALTQGCGDSKTLVVVDAIQGVQAGAMTTVADGITAADVRDRLPDPTFTLDGVTLAGFT
ncbi:MAG: hypothetical protein HKN03_02175 [Acidimicrobiales bacterium]|nr:hypothetical protein [Acidimicrobiales bacterium]